MRLTREERCEVLVVGGGLAGVSAALEAARQGARVTLLAAGGVFSGSSFYPGTWGLGLIGPENDADRADLAQTILSVGCGMARPALVRTLVDGIAPAIDALRRSGVRLRRAGQAGQREFIPCFDHKVRDWNGIEFDSARPILEAQLRDLGVRILRAEVLDTVRAEGRVCGVIAAYDDALHYLSCRVLVLATGGTGGLFRDRLTTGDVTGSAHALALCAGAALTNLEFFQMMPGYRAPAQGTIFNEKTFRFAQLWTANTPLLPQSGYTARLLAQRSTHGPFTTRLPTSAVDLAIFAQPNGVVVHYTDDMKTDPPEFVSTYFDWLRREKGLTWDDPVRIGIFTHASNGGIVIDPLARTGVEGLLACGEATGGMHGADRIGGLSTANGLVFGTIAGRTAARDAAADAGSPRDVEFDAWATDEDSEKLRTLRETLSRNAMLARTEAGLSGARDTLHHLTDGIHRRPAATLPETIRAHRLACQLVTADALLAAALLRRESRGAHHRDDYPSPHDILARRIEITHGTQGVRARLIDETNE